MSDPVSATFPVHDEPLICVYCGEPAHVGETFEALGIKLSECEAVPRDAFVEERLAVRR